MPTHYQVLDIPTTATNDQIRSAYLALAKKYHPDVSKDKSAEEKMKLVNVAYTVLSDQTKKWEYDRNLKKQAGRPNVNDMFNEFFGKGKHSGRWASSGFAEEVEKWASAVDGTFRRRSGGQGSPDPFGAFAGKKSQVEFDTAPGKTPPQYANPFTGRQADHFKEGRKKISEEELEDKVIRLINEIKKLLAKRMYVGWNEQDLEKLNKLATMMDAWRFM